MRLIDADALVKKRAHAKQYEGEMYVIGQGYVMDAPTIDLVCVKRGGWIKDCETLVHCSECKCARNNFHNQTTGNLWNYCPNCGAKMEVAT